MDNITDRYRIVVVQCKPFAKQRAQFRDLNCSVFSLQTLVKIHICCLLSCDCREEPTTRMSVLNQSGEDAVECPLCMEPLEVDDLNFFPCTCGYQICRFCWHRIRTDENGLCPACRKAYSENPADFKPLTKEEIARYLRQRIFWSILQRMYPPTFNNIITL